MAEPLTRDAVVAATRHLISRDGLDAVSLRRVGAALGVTAPALYAYVDDKSDLLRAVADQEFATLIDRFSAVDDPDPIERTRRYSRIYITYALEQPELFKVMFLFRPRIGPENGPGEILDSATVAFARPTESLDEAIEAGRLRETDPLLATFTTFAAAHGAAEVLLMGFDFDDELRERIIDSVIDTVIHGLSA